MAQLTPSQKEIVESWETDGGAKQNGSTPPPVHQPKASPEPPPTFILAPLPYVENALAPVISAQTVSFHYGKHHAGYVNTLNRLIDGTAFSGETLEHIIVRAAEEPAALGIYRNAAQVWNHNFYWVSMAPTGGGEPTGPLLLAIERDFSSYGEFRAAFSKAAIGAFGSGWVWLVVTPEGKLEILVTSDADTPLTKGAKPLITLDLWEHAYYLDHQNKRIDYVEGWFDRLVDWRFAEKNLSTPMA
jgi:Fe-Mn family superoxide dismutase